MAYPRVAIILGSDSDLDTVDPAVKVCTEFGVTCDVQILSAHRTPDELADYVKKADLGGTAVFIAAAGGAAALPGVVAALSQKPVIGVPVQSQALNGIDSLLSIAQMPGGVPVATMAIGKPGGKNAGLLAIRILALSDEGLARKYAEYRQKMAREVLDKNRKK